MSYGTICYFTTKICLRNAKFRRYCACAQSHGCLNSMLIHTLYNSSDSEQQRPGSACASAKADPGFRNSLWHDGAPPLDETQTKLNTFVF